MPYIYIVKRNAVGVEFIHSFISVVGFALSIVVWYKILFNKRVEIENAVVLTVKRNALQVLIPKYGLEGPIYLPNDMFKYNEEEHVQKCGDVVLKTFDELVVRLSLNDKNVQHRKLEFQLVKPFIKDFSYVEENTMEVEEVAEKNKTSIEDKKRKEQTDNTSAKRKKNKKK